jgi:hypothetical protein
MENKDKKRKISEQLNDKINVTKKRSEKIVQINEENYQKS